MEYFAGLDVSMKETYTGQTKVERYDADLPLESAELLAAALDALEGASPGALPRMASDLGLAAGMFELLTGRILNQSTVPIDDKVVRYVDFAARRH